ncbi:bifunctional hydroxymethylpyrimidine kinase/phosphomethylpyrimidine kinase [Bacteroides helcogenes]|uniref:hydroxymethylpyrimidine kinase n=1 Tax=Bacteroides helcogenes (strain ATCC 35417 / DSM 20613 / JCM 6297 / CCUG 15421 / P 36-108) TaxID=693979 RepID=E6SU62_BACT6|nr:bifunctional hydroxymethylpyrimidine kinase/phosphomethylpyrimidine kinase [Bacteroides helcogenes]ADV44335.1 phosphomethylpyrimidine kinase [Bacteroides helcogenes P 36-108]MDY5238256.1 bifunctional hydroxymethylpyrimidine kinase/phosphomethylpyrimidine kinase [Bacteroides helcogenes]
MNPPVILTIAGSDCSGGAGIQADIKTISALKGYAASAITTVTAQNTLGVQAVFPLSAHMVRMQIESVMNDLQPTAIKIGMVHDADIVHAIAGCLRKYRPRFVVYDPVMIATSGCRLMAEETVQTIKDFLFPLCTLITPNLAEAGLLCAKPVTTVADMEQVAQELSQRYGTSFLIKGGHLDGDVMCDVLHCNLPSTENATPILFTGSKILSRNLHGTGCTLSSAIATFLAYGNDLDEAVRRAKKYIGDAITDGKGLHIGHGNGPLWHFPPLI